MTLFVYNSKYEMEGNIMELLVDIGHKLKNLRLEKDVTLEELAQSIGSSRSLLSKYERGASEPGLRQLKKLADFYDVSLDYLFGFTCDKRPVISSERLNELFASLSENKKREAIRYLQFLNVISKEKE